MALITCHECGAKVSSEAVACPKCGAMPKLPTPSSPGIFQGKIGWREIAGFVAVVVGIVWVMPSTKSGNPTAAVEEVKPAPVNFDLPLVSATAALVCPFSVLDDKREGRGWQAALKSRVEMFGRHEDAVKAGCDEWREGEPIRLSDVEIQAAKHFQAKDSCGMLGFDAGVVFSCDVRNATNVSTGSLVPQPLSPAKPNAKADAPPPAAVVSELSEAEKPLPPRLQENQPAMLTGVYASGTFDDCCDAGQSKQRSYGSVRLDHSITLRDLGPNAKAVNENLIGYVELGGLTEAQRAAIGDEHRISVSCSSLYIGDTGHYAAAAFCKDARVTLRESVDDAKNNATAAIAATADAPANMSGQPKASFDCRKAHSDAENLICADRDLIARDADLFRHYVATKARVRALLSADQFGRFITEGKLAWTQREAQCHLRECVVDWYALREAQLSMWDKHEPPASPAHTDSDSPQSPRSTAPNVRATPN